MEIRPNGTIRLFSGVPLDSTYRNTIYFDNISEQMLYFAGTTSPVTVVRNFEKQYYTRVNRGVIKVKEVADNLYNCNYLAFQNTMYGHKWFYAFITSVEWVNNEVTQITFELDVMQTYMFDATLLQSMVLREHGALDVIGLNRVPEPVDIGEVVPNQATYDRFNSANQLCTVIGVMDETKTAWSELFPWFEQVSGKTYNGVYGGLTLFAFIGDNHINAFLDKYKATPNNIVVIYVCPVCAITGSGSAPADMYTDDGYEISPYDGGRVITWEPTSAVSASMTLDGYTPRNLKLLTSPYNYYTVFSSDGNSLNFKYEDFTYGAPQFEVHSNLTYPPNMQLTPNNYKRMEHYKTESLLENDYPLCSWYADYYSRWLAQVGVPTFQRQSQQGIINFIHGGFDSAWGAARGGNKEDVRFALTSNLNRSLEIEANAIANFFTERQMALAQEEIFKGSISGGSIAISSGQKTFRGVRMSVKYEIAQRIDAFFDVYGYATNLYKVPNRHVRPYYTYTKTAGCNITGSMPVEAIDLMKSIYDAGITFWDKNAVVGDYSVDNRPY